MGGSNEKTLETYEKNFQDYISGTTPVTRSDQFQGQWILSVLDRLSKDARILEIGSAFGRDARFMAEQGYINLEVTDAFDAAVAYLRNHNLEAKKLNVLTDSMTGSYDLIFAAAVFLHFTSDELHKVLDKLRRHITASGYLAFSVKQGEGDEWSDHKMSGPRYFHYYSADELTSLLGEQGYHVIDMRSTRDHKWLHITAQIVR